MGVGLEENVPRLPGTDLELVDLPLAKSRQKKFPDAALPAVAHRVPAAVPSVEVAHHGNPLGVGSPDGEGDSGNPFPLHEMDSELPVQLEVGSLPEKMDVEVGEDASEGVRVLLPKAESRVVFELDPVRERFLSAGKDRLEDTDGVQPAHLRPVLFPARGGQNDGVGGAWEDRPYGDCFPRFRFDDVRPEDRERVPVARLRETVEVLLAHGSFHGIHCIGKRSFPGNWNRKWGSGMPKAAVTETFRARFTDGRGRRSRRCPSPRRGSPRRRSRGSSPGRPWRAA